MAHRKMTGEEREAEIRRKLLINAERVRIYVTDMSAAERQGNQAEIDAYSVALRRWKDRESGGRIPDTPSFMRIDRSVRHRGEDDLTRYLISQARGKQIGAG